MKKLLSLFVVLVCIISLAACSGTSNQKETKPITCIDDVDWKYYCSGEAKSRAWYYYNNLYDVDISYSGISVNKVEKDRNGIYTCYGKVNGKDNYGNRCSADFSVTCEVDLEMAQKIIDNGGVGENPNDNDPYSECVEGIDFDYGSLRKG